MIKWIGVKERRIMYQLGFIDPFGPFIYNNKEIK